MQNQAQGQGGGWALMCMLDSHSTLLTPTSNWCNKHWPWGRFYTSIRNVCQSHQKGVGEASHLSEFILLMLKKPAPLCHGDKTATIKLHGCKITWSGRHPRRRLHLNIRGKSPQLCDTSIHCWHQAFIILFTSYIKILHRIQGNMHGNTPKCFQITSC